MRDRFVLISSARAANARRRSESICHHSLAKLWCEEIISNLSSSPTSLLPALHLIPLFSFTRGMVVFGRALSAPSVYAPAAAALETWSMVGLNLLNALLLLGVAVLVAIGPLDLFAVLTSRLRSRPKSSRRRSSPAPPLSSPGVDNDDDDNIEARFASSFLSCLAHNSVHFRPQVSLNDGNGACALVLQNLTKFVCVCFVCCCLK